MNILNLDEFEVLKVETNDYYYRITVEKKEKPYFCTHCMWDTMQSKIFKEDEGKDFKLHSNKERIVSDISMHGKAVKIIIKHKRYRCPFCDKTFYEMLESVDRNDKVTIRLKEHIKQLSLRKPFLQIAEEYGISHQSVRRYFLEFVKEQEEDKVLKAPRVLGIDEVHLNKEMRCVVTDIENRYILDMIHTRTKRDVKKLIKSMNGYKNIEIVTMDMYTGYMYAVRELTPNATIVVDKFHVVQYAIRAKVLYGTKATKKPKFGESNFYTIGKMFENIGNEPQTVTREDRNKVIEGFGVDVITLREIMEGNNF